MSYDSFPVRRPLRRSRSSFGRGGFGPGSLFIVGLILVIVIAVGGVLVERSTQGTVTFKVTDKAIMATGKNGNGHQYMIYTNHGVYKDTDSFAFFKYNSSDLYGNLQVGKTYTCKVSGWRFTFTSSYKNLISCHRS